MFKELWRDVVVARGCAWSDFLEDLVQFLDCEWLYSTTSLFAPVLLPPFVTDLPSDVLLHWRLRYLRGCGFESHPWRKFNFCRALTLWVYSAHLVNEYRLSVAGVLHIELGLKIRVYVLR